MPTLYCEPEDPDADLHEEPTAVTCHEWCLLAEDLITVRIAETDTWIAHAVTAEHALGHSRWNVPALVVREHEEETPEGTLVFLLLAFRAESDEAPTILFGECAMSPDLYRYLRKPYGMRQPIPREANPPFPDEELPTEFDERCWTELLGGSGSGNHEEW